MNPMSLAREAKHQVYVVRKRGRRRAKKLKFDVATKLFWSKQRWRPYSYDGARYAGTFLAEDVAPTGSSQLPAHVFVVWAGSNPMSANRTRNLAVIEERIGLPVHLVTPDSLPEWLVAGHPLPAAYEHLSFVHRSDYLRGYLMHHHGGAYVDVKEPYGSWLPSHERMAADPDAWATSYQTTHADWIGKLPGRMGSEILVNYRLMFGKSGFMMRSHTPLTAAWMARMHAVLDERGADLAAHPGGVYGDDAAYPMSWTDLLGRVLDPLTLKHLGHVRYDDRMLLRFEDYR
jgi:hypothetical protein